MNECKACSNCIHEDVCEMWRNGTKDADCVWFKNKSQYIKLPCAVGDTVYHLAHGYIEQEHVRGYTVHFLTNGYGFYQEAYGNTVFPTHSAAEEALRRAREKYNKTGTA